MKVVAFVPIRLNSKRVVGKNLKLLGGKPMMCYLLETLVKVPQIDEVYVYCSSDEVREFLPEGVKLLKRDTALDSDMALGEEIYDAFVREVDADVYMLAHTTSPFIKASTISAAVNEVVEGGHDSAFSAQKIQTFAWYEGKPLNYSPTNIPRTQTIEPVFVETSAFYIFRRDIWVEHHRRVGFNPYMALVGPVEGVDIDYPEDFEFAEKIIGK
ncbi:MAG: acylneuraminate cytidylyltransferase family protein [Bacteroidaceae bacterium]|nr:acylneuraminate cytidylyltransferase family protein [Bacteroidaceae bacterium]